MSDLDDRRRRFLGPWAVGDPDAAAKTAYQREIYRLARGSDPASWEASCAVAARQLGPFGPWIVQWRRDMADYVARELASREGAVA